MPMYQNFHFTAKANLEDTVKAVEKIMNETQWHIVHEFDRFDMSADYTRNRPRGLFGRQRMGEKNLKPDVTIRYKEAGGKIIVYMLSDEAFGDAIAAATSQDPDKRKFLTETYNALTEGLRAKDML